MYNTNLNISLMKTFIKFFNPNKIMEIAKENGFIKRNDGKLLPVTFVKALTIGILNNHNVTLQKIANKCEEIQPNIKITREAIFQRMGAGAKLMKEMLKVSISTSIDSQINCRILDIFKLFKNVYISDSTLINVSKKLKDEFPCAGGNNPNGSVRIQAIYNLSNRIFKKLEVFKGNSSDNKYAEEIVKELSEKDLSIFDLGYFSIKILKKIISKEAYFISKVLDNTTFYSIDSDKENTKEQIDLLAKCRKSKDFLDIPVYIGKMENNRAKVRLVAIKLPEAVANKRRRTANKNAKGKTLSDYKLELLGWVILITNIPEEKICAKAICEIYRIRWQIEIIFKGFKSYLDFNDLSSARKEQLECILYGRLINAVLITLIYSACYVDRFVQSNRELSILKFYNYATERHYSIMQWIERDLANAKNLLELFERIAANSLYDKRNRITTMQKIDMYFLPAMEKAA